MKSNPKRQGQFEVFNSFAIMRRQEFYLIGRLREGEVAEGWFVNIPFNTELSLTLRIQAVEEILVTGEEQPYKLLIVSSDPEMLDMFLALRIEREFLDITIEGED